MPNLQVIRTGIASLPDGPPLVVAVVAGTTGIGSYIVRALAKTFAKHGSKLRVYIIGRQASRAEPLITFSQQISPGSDFRFIQASDLSLLSDVDRVSQEIIAQEEASPFAGGPPRLDVLYMSQALSPMQPSSPTKEGLDTQMSLIYYSRIHFIQRLTPLLTAAPATAHVISVFAGSMEETIKPGAPLPIGTPPPQSYGINTVRGYMNFMKTFVFEELAERHAQKISFTHIFPGLVDGPTFYSDVNPLWFRILWRILKPLISWHMTSPETCGEVMVFMATQRYPAKGAAAPGDDVAYSTQRELGGGAYGVSERGDETKNVKYGKTRKDDIGKKVWEHTMGILDGIVKKNTGS